MKKIVLSLSVSIGLMFSGLCLAMPPSHIMDVNNMAAGPGMDQGMAAGPAAHGMDQGMGAGPAGPGMDQGMGAGPAGSSMDQGVSIVKTFKSYPLCYKNARKIKKRFVYVSNPTSFCNSFPRKIKKKENIIPYLMDNLFNTNINKIDAKSKSSDKSKNNTTKAYQFAQTCTSLFKFSGNANDEIWYFCNIPDNENCSRFIKVLKAGGVDAGALIEGNATRLFHCEMPMKYYNMLTTKGRWNLVQSLYSNDKFNSPQKLTNYFKLFKFKNDGNKTYSAKTCKKFADNLLKGKLTLKNHISELFGCKVAVNDLIYWRNHPELKSCVDAIKAKASVSSDNILAYIKKNVFSNNKTKLLVCNKHKVFLKRYFGGAFNNDNNYFVNKSTGSKPAKCQEVLYNLVVCSKIGKQIAKSGFCANYNNTLHHYLVNNLNSMYACKSTINASPTNKNGFEKLYKNATREAKYTTTQVTEQHKIGKAWDAISDGGDYAMYKQTYTYVKNPSQMKAFIDFFAASSTRGITSEIRTLRDDNVAMPSTFEGVVPLYLEYKRFDFLVRNARSFKKYYTASQPLPNWVKNSDKIYDQRSDYKNKSKAGSLEFCNTLYPDIGNASAQNLKFYNYSSYLFDSCMKQFRAQKDIISELIKKKKAMEYIMNAYAENVKKQLPGS